MDTVEKVLRDIELLDKDFRANGISDAYKKKWNVVTNVGPWTIGLETVDLLRTLIGKYRPKNIVEIGTSVGYSTIIMAKAASKFSAKVTSIELEEYKYKEARENLAKTSLENVELVHDDASEVLKTWNEPIDFFFLDGNKRGYLTQFQLAEPYFSDDVIIIADNVNDMRKQVQDFLDYMQSHANYMVEVLEIDHGVLLAKKYLSPT